MYIEFNWVIKVDNDAAKSIEKEVTTKISSDQSYTNLVFVVAIDKNPKGGANIIATNDDNSIRLEGYYQGHPSSLSLIRWAKNPLPHIR